MATGIVRDDRYLDHFMEPGHVECPERLEAIHEWLDREAGLGLERIEPRPATPDELAYVHAPEYVGFISLTAGKPRIHLDPDTSTSSRSYETARLASGGVIAAAEAILDGRVRNGMALVRPPGHHAERGQAKGFCIFNNVAVAAEHLLRRRGLRRVLIADWDVHHGNGTQHAFYGRKDVLFFSTHRFPFYPGTGFRDEVGTGEGRGFTVNIPLGPAKGDEDYLHVYRTIFRPIARAYAPEFILVSAGFDIYRADPLGGMDVTFDGFAALAAEIVAAAEEACGGRLLLVLEGGYNLEGQAEAVKRVLLQLAKAEKPPEIRVDPTPTTLKELAPAVEIQRAFWPV